MPAFVEVREQRAVVRADVDDEVVRLERKALLHLAVQLGEVLAQHPRRAARVRIAGREQHRGIDGEAELGEVAVAGRRAAPPGYQGSSSAGAPSVRMLFTGGR